MSHLPPAHIRHVVHNNNAGKPYEKPASIWSWVAGGIFIGLMGALGATQDVVEISSIPRGSEIIEDVRITALPDSDPVKMFTWAAEAPAAKAKREIEIKRRDAEAYAKMHKWRQEAFDEAEEQAGNERAAQARTDAARLALQASRDRLIDINTERYVRATNQAAEDIRQLSRVRTPDVNVTVQAPKPVPQEDRIYVRGPTVGVYRAR